MTALVTIDPQDFEGRLLPWRDGRHFPIDDLNDAIEYLANRHGVITVNNGMDGAGRALLRLAAAEEPANYRKGIERLAAGFGEMRAAPKRALQRNRRLASHEDARRTCRTPSDPAE